MRPRHMNEVRAISELSPVEYAPNGIGQYLAAERFLNQLDPRIQTPLMHNGVAGVTRHEENLQTWMTIARLLGKGPTVHAWHDDIGEQQRQAFVFIDHAKGVVATVCLKHVISQA